MNFPDTHELPRLASQSISSVGSRRSGIEVAFTREEWQALRGLFGEALALPEVQPVLEELSLVYGEI